MKRKGVTPVIAIIMLLLIVVVMVGGVFAWMQTMQEDVEGMTQEQLASFLEEAQEHISIESYSCNHSTTPPNVTDIYVRNTDEVDDYTVAAYVNGGLINNSITLESNKLTNLNGTVADNSERGDTLELAMEGDTLASKTFSC